MTTAKTDNILSLTTDYIWKYYGFKLLYKPSPEVYTFKRIGPQRTILLEFYMDEGFCCAMNVEKHKSDKYKEKFVVKSFDVDSLKNIEMDTAIETQIELVKNIFRDPMTVTKYPKLLINDVAEVGLLEDKMT